MPHFPVTGPESSLLPLSPRRVSLLRRRAQDAAAHLRDCHLCERQCHVNRSAGELGDCRAGPIARMFRHRVEWSEELELTPSHVFYLSGCDLRCAFCIAEADAFDPDRGTPLTAEAFTAAVRWGKDQGAQNVQWLGGEATIHLPHILNILGACDEPLRVVWKSNFHMTVEALQILDGVADVYVADFKFGNDRCAEDLAAVPNYLNIVTRNLQIAATQGDLIVRHLVMPGHIDCCLRPVVLWLTDHMPGVKFSLRDGYVPAWRAHHFPNLGRVLTRHEVERAQDIVEEFGLNCIQ